MKCLAVARSSPQRFSRALLNGCSYPWVAPDDSLFPAWRSRPA
jgi:hypothetical protein